MDDQLKNIDVVILCGGLGKRLRPLINDRPKCLAEINNRPFLDILIDYIASYGFRRVILSLGYMKERIKKHYQAKSMPLEILYSEEEEPVGTGGALSLTKPLIKSRTFLVMNGDSFCPVNFSNFFNFHLLKKALVSIALTKLKQGQNCGKVTLDNDQRIISFQEKAIIKDKNYSSVGIYFMESQIFSLIGKKEKFSLEYDFFPNLLSRKCYGYITEKDLIDIGTPEEYKKAQSLSFNANN